MLRATAQKKLTNVMGHERGPRCYSEVCPELGLDDIHTPDDSLRFGNAQISGVECWRRLGARSRSWHCCRAPARIVDDGDGDGDLPACVPEAFVHGFAILDVSLARLWPSPLSWA